MTDEPVQGEGEDAPAESAAPYRNLFVPLFVVPAGIVMVLVLVFVLFGQIAGHEASLDENLERVRGAGRNERAQALLLVVQQVQENWAAVQEGRELPWPVEGDLVERLERVWDETPREEASFRYVLASALLQADPQAGLDRLIECLAYGEEEDPGGKVRFHAAVALGVLARDAGPAERARVGEAVAPLLDGGDAGLTVVAAAALQNVPGEASRAALRGLLGADSLEVRGQAAVSLSHLGDPAGAAVLWELLDPDAFARERERNREKFADRGLVSAVRRRAVAALVRLARPEDLERLRTLSREEPDLEVREAVLRGLADGPEGASPR